MGKRYYNSRVSEKSGSFYQYKIVICKDFTWEGANDMERLILIGGVLVFAAVFIVILYARLVDTSRDDDMLE